MREPCWSLLDQVVRQTLTFGASAALTTCLRLSQANRINCKRRAQYGEGTRHAKGPAWEREFEATLVCVTPNFAVDLPEVDLAQGPSDLFLLEARDHAALLIC